MSAQTKHLGFVESTANSAMATAESTYSSAKGKTVSATNSVVTGIFYQLERFGSPLVAFSQRGAHSMLLLADKTVDKSVSAVNTTAKMSRTSATKLVGERRVSKAEGVAADAVAAVTGKVNTICNERIPAGARAVKSNTQRVYAEFASVASNILNRLSDGLHAADSAAASVVGGLQSRAAAARDGVYARAAAARDSVYELQARTKAAYSDVYHRVVPPISGYALGTYSAVRDTITALPVYARGYHAAADALAYGADTSAARTAKAIYTDRVYPVIAPLADKSEPYVRAALRQARPSPAAEAAVANGAAAGLPDDEIVLQRVDVSSQKNGKPVRRKVPVNGSAAPAPVPVQEALADDACPSVLHARQLS